MTRSVWRATAPRGQEGTQGPHPAEDRDVYHWFEMCEAVQSESYVIDGIGVSNFVLPLYFTSSDERGGRNDFLGTTHRGKTLESFRANPGGYINYFDPVLGEDTDWEPKSTRSQERLAVKKNWRSGEASAAARPAPRGFD
ncbi:MAG TPA: hypothetical protein VKA59_19360 [Vicinamibacterales bacterium]|nr:hypothetical protein [Vicinamibacterales bacterium]